MSGMRNILRRVVIRMMGEEVRPRRIVRGLASGYRIVVSPNKHLGYLFGTSEPHLQRIIRRYVSDGDTAYDIGANIGYVSLSLSNQVGPLGIVYAFEPVAESLALLKKSIAINHLSNVRALGYAASRDRGRAVIRVGENLATASLVWHVGECSIVEQDVETIAVDALVESGELRTPRFVKIDVEGAEGLVLEGMYKTIDSARPYIFLECSDAGRHTSWQLLSGLHYRCQSAVTGEPVTTFNEYRHSDFLWLPR
jgi:FkbM family methyltransferase